MPDEKGMITIGAASSSWSGFEATPLFAPSASPSEWAPDRDRLFAALRTRGLDGLVVQLRPNVFYISGYASPASEIRHETEGGAAVVISMAAPDHPILVMEAVDVAQMVTHPSWIKDIRVYLTHLISPDMEIDGKTFDRFAPRAVRATEWGARARAGVGDSLKAQTRGAMRELGLTTGRVGFDNLMFADGTAPPAVSVVSAGSIMKFVRQVKTAEEIRRLRNGAALNAKAIENTVASWHRGMRWSEINHIYDLNCVALGGWVQYGGGIALSNAEEPDTVFNPQYAIEDFVIEPGVSLMLDCHGQLEHYRWDGGKTWVVDDERRGTAALIQRASTEASEALLEGLRPGTGVNELQLSGREVFRKMKVPESDLALVFFHGMGLDHTDIEVTGDGATPNWKLEENMVLATHVAFPGGGATRFYLEDVALVTPSGGKSLYDWGLEPHYNR